MATFNPTANAPAFTYAEVDTSLIPPRPRHNDATA
jgi:hypothetical protein